MYIMIVVDEGQEVARIRRDTTMELRRIESNWIENCKRSNDPIPTFTIKEYGD